MELPSEYMSFADPTSTDPVMDVKTAVERLGSEKLLRKVAGVFQANAAKHAADIEEAIAAGDSKKLEMAAHTLVSSMAYLSAADASAAAMKLEHMGRDGVTEGRQAAYEALMLEIDRLAEALTPLL
jgi:HPt (histidine-containing phosphotransfer) domain-containing protein